jgi:UDP-N-acetylglucosamine 2-epimerase
VEAGLRSFDLSSPFPEEVNRRVATCTASVHFAPTTQSRDHLISEGIPEEDIVVTGNTVVDALRMIPRLHTFTSPALNAVPWDRRRIVLVTVHRRESLGAPLDGLCDAFLQLAERHPDVQLVFPVHLNPRVRDVVHARLSGHPRITLLEPLAYPELLEVMRRSTLILSDSGGIQEEAPSLRKPILILRDCTERPEVIDAGFGELVGTDAAHVVARASLLLTDAALYQQRTLGVNPFGDGHAAERVVQTIADRLRHPSIHQRTTSARPRRRGAHARTPRPRQLMRASVLTWSSQRCASRCACCALLGPRSSLHAQAPLGIFGGKWIEAGLTAHQVSGDLGDWRGAWVRTVVPSGTSQHPLGRRHRPRSLW